MSPQCKCTFSSALCAHVLGHFPVLSISENCIAAMRTTVSIPLLLLCYRIA